MKKYSILFILVFLLIGCAQSTDVQECVADDPYGFWGGLWHGFILIFSFIGSLFNSDIALYAVDNNGGWYNFGFMIGQGSILSVFYKKEK